MLLEVLSAWNETASIKLPTQWQARKIPYDNQNLRKMTAQS